MSHNRPTATDILDAVRECLQEQILPVCTDSAVNLNVRICMNLLNTVGREIGSADEIFQQERNTLGALLACLNADKYANPSRMSNEQMNLALQDYISLNPEAVVDKRIITALYAITLAKMSIDNPKYPLYRKLAGE